MVLPDQDRCAGDGQDQEGDSDDDHPAASRPASSRVATLDRMNPAEEPYPHPGPAGDIANRTAARAIERAGGASRTVRGSTLELVLRLGGWFGQTSDATVE